jgi:hypothetical protein
MATEYSPQTVTNGLVLYLDAANPRSYVSGSTNWNNLTNTAPLSGSLINGPTYSSANLGSIVFDGTDDYVTLGTQNLVTNDFSISIWFNSTSNVTKEHFLFSLGYNLSNSFLLTQDTVLGNTSVLQSYYTVGGAVTARQISTTVPNTALINLSFVRASGVNTPYINGIPQTERIFTENVTLGSSTYVLGWAIPRNKSTAYMQGNIYNFQMYNRALTANEVQQNFNALRGRYGL